MQDMKAWLTILITIYFYSSSNGEDVTNCSSTGIWSSWSSWQNVMPNNSDGLYLQLRKRLCQENPQNCTTKTKDYCNDFYAEVKLCGSVANSPIHCSNKLAIYAPTNATTATALNARSIAAVIPTNIVTSATTVAATATLTTVAAAPAAVTAKSTTIAYVSDTEAATSTTAVDVKTTAAVNIFAIFATGNTITIPHADTSHSKITIIDVLTTAAATFATRSTGSAIFTTAVATLTTTAATLATTTAVASTPDCCKLDVVSTLGCCDGPTTAAAESTTSASTLDCCGLDVVLILDCCTVRTTAATISTTAASTVDCCKMDVVPVLDCCNVPYTAAVEPATETAISATTTAKLDCCGDAALMLDCCDVSNIPTLPTTVMRPMIPLATTGSVMIEICSGCNNVLPISGMQLKNGERNGYLAVVYGANPFGCRTADLICDSGFLVNQTAIVYANGVKNIPLAMSLTGKAQVTLTCDENVRWKAPNSIINIWNVTCIFRDQPIPTTPVPTTVPPKPCSTCMNLITARVKNPALNEGEGKLAIEYTLNEFGCRVAKIICSSSDENVETIIYFNGMKNMPVISSKVGAATILLSCHENRRFRVDSSRANVENVTCLTRDLPIPTTTKPTTTTPVTIPTIGPPLCAICENIKGILRKNLQSNEMNAPLRIEYSKQTDGCRAAFIVCGYEKPGAVARIYFNEETMLPFIADTSGEAQLELICGNNARWRAFESSINIASISCTVLDIQPIPTTTQPKPPPVTTIPTILPIPTTTPRCIAKWTTWEPWSVCTDTCGAYGSRQRFRSCERTREDCFCLGRLSETEFCNLQPCLYPRNACRPKYMVSSVNQKFACVPIQ